MTVHSTQLAHRNPVPTSATVIYTVPTGKRTIVKSLVLFNTNGAAEAVYCDIKSGSSLLATISVHVDTVGSVGDTTYRDCWIVLDTGQTLSAAATATGMLLVVSGAELKL